MSKDGGNLTVQYNLRWTEEMRDKIAAIAKENTRSMNQEIIHRLEQSFEINPLTKMTKEEQKANAEKAISILSADELMLILFKKFNSKGLSLTIEEIDKLKDHKKAP